MDFQLNARSFHRPGSSFEFLTRSVYILSDVTIRYIRDDDVKSYKFSSHRNVDIYIYRSIIMHFTALVGFDDLYIYLSQSVTFTNLYSFEYI